MAGKRSLKEQPNIHIKFSIMMMFYVCKMNNSPKQTKQMALIKKVFYWSSDDAVNPLVVMESKQPSPLNDFKFFHQHSLWIIRNHSTYWLALKAISVSRKLYTYRDKQSSNQLLTTVIISNQVKCVLAMLIGFPTTNQTTTTNVSLVETCRDCIYRMMMMMSPMREFHSFE